MQLCSCLLLSCLMLVTLLHLHLTEGLTVQHTSAQHVNRPVLRPRQRAVKMGAELRAKLLRLAELSGAENDVMEPKRKRSYSGNNAPIDRLSVSSMETKQAANRQSKVVELPRRRVSPPPIDRIGASRLPTGRG